VSAPSLMLTVPGLPAELTGVALSRDGRHFAVSSLDGTVTICDAHSGKKIRTLDGKAGPVYGLAFNPVSKALASAHYNGTVMVWDIDRRGGKADLPIRTISAHADAVFGVAYSANGRLLATAGGRDHEKNIGIWEAETGKQIVPASAVGFVRSVAFSPDGGRLACASRAWVSLVDVKTGKELRISEGERALRVAFGPDGRLLATACEGQTVRILNADTGQEVPPLRVSGGELWNVAFSPDGRYLATCSGYKGKGTIQLWDASRWKESTVPSP